MINEKEFDQATEKAQKIYNNLVRQRDAAYSKTLRLLLSDEIDALVRMKDAFAEYVYLHREKIKSRSERRLKEQEETLERIKSISNPILAEDNLKKAERATQYIYAMDRFDLIAYNQSIQLYLQAINRDYKNWDKFVKKVVKSVGDTTTDIASIFVPILSAVQFIRSIVNKATHLKSEYEDDGTDYFETDRQLKIIELHIEMLEKTTDMFVELKEILTSEEQEDSGNFSDDWFNITKQ